MNRYWIAMVCSVLIASISQMFLKKAASKQYDSHIKEYLNISVVFGYFLMFLSTILSIYAFRVLDYKNGSVINSLGYIFVLVMSRIIFKESITKNKIIGIGLILIGVCVFYL